MSNKQGSARDYVQSYVQESSLKDDYLKTEQPRYDPSKPIPTAPHHEPQEQQQQQQQQDSTSFNIHLPTQNPMPSGEYDSDSVQERPQLTLTPSDFKEQRKDIHETALTVCVDLHENLLSCFQHGSWWDKAKMCEEQKQKFWHCYNNQKV
ncbi:uncharacterized protein B0P05DRAFT_526947 [Gilbertella persicaria]|uniref:COX assembly mitochondrial protein n=1 Tax=Rhizopus stolonifer TaxID=4846 RepID=A0A367KYL3_RHIST|nr:uncharacterized protein B0P05DRAFT_526947 [Gilbertella persicaria]KAI8091314.1 hypothetical protein B0P05DRAFT_526947 [Gilbertella persicaria]RCI07217.1 hypothetical protein CU098_011932 [Rhizopus stolonifer]